MDTNSMQLHPEYERLMEKKQRYAEQLADLIEQEHYMLHHQYYVVLTEYMEKLGTREYELFELNVEVLKLKRRADLVRAYLNRQEHVDEKAIQRTLEKEFASYQRQLEEMVQSIENANGFALSQKQLTAVAAEEIKALYKQLVKRLHPDAANRFTEQTDFLWNQVKEAYENGDLDRMRALYELAETAGELNETEWTATSLNQLKVKTTQLKQTIKLLIQKLAALSSTFPFDQLPFLIDESAVNVRQLELEEQINALRMQHQHARVILEKLMQQY